MTQQSFWSEACERNKQPILTMLRQALAGRREVLEIGSGTGQHALYFAEQMPSLTWHPTERPAQLAPLAERIAARALPNVRAALPLDVTQRVWPVPPVDAVFTANTLHIMSWPAVMALFHGITTCLAPNGTVCVYGPFNYARRFTSPSNETFDAWLRARDADSGIRDIEAVRELAAGSGLAITADHDMPAHNRLVVFESSR